MANRSRQHFYILLEWRRKKKTNNLPAGYVVLIRERKTARLGKVDDALYVVFVKDLSQFTLILGREEDTLCRNVRDLVQKLFHGMRRTVELEAQSDKLLRDSYHFRTSNITTNQHARICGGDFEASRAQERRPICLMDVFSEARDFAGASHF